MDGTQTLASLAAGGRQGQALATTSAGGQGAGRRAGEHRETVLANTFNTKRTHRSHRTSRVSSCLLMVLVHPLVGSAESITTHFSWDQPRLVEPCARSYPLGFLSCRTVFARFPRIPRYLFRARHSQKLALSLKPTVSRHPASLISHPAPAHVTHSLPARRCVCCAPSSRRRCIWACR